jgi:hypothetical protein
VRMCSTSKAALKCKKQARPRASVQRIPLCPEWEVGGGFAEAWNPEIVPWWLAARSGSSFDVSSTKVGQRSRGSICKVVATLHAYFQHPFILIARIPSLALRNSVSAATSQRPQVVYEAANPPHGCLTLARSVFD